MADELNTIDFICPCCGTRTTITLPIRAEELSLVAYTVLTARGDSRTERDAVKAWRSGHPIATAMLSRMTGYSRRQVRRGLLELQRAGYVAPIHHPRGVQFAGVPTTMGRISSLAA